MQKFQAAGMGDSVNSWVGRGRTCRWRATRSGNVLRPGPDVADLAERMGLSTGDLSAQMAQVLPQAVDHFTPNGKVPEGGLGNLGDLLGQLMRR